MTNRSGIRRDYADRSWLRQKEEETPLLHKIFLWVAVFAVITLVVGLLAWGIFGGVYHTVESGETLWSIARDQRTSPYILEKLNPGIHPDRLYPGQRIRVR
jgi:hypothetical protein